MASTLTLTFNSSPEVSINQILNINVDIGGGQTSTFSEIFKESRTKNFEIAVISPYDEEAMAFDFYQYWNLDYSSSSNLLDNITAAPAIGTASISLILNNRNWQFLDPTGTAISNGGISFSKSNVPVITPSTVSINSYSKNVSNNCGLVDVDLEVTGGSGTYNAYVNNSVVLANQTSPFVVTIDRGIPKSIRIVDPNSGGLLIGTAQTVNTRTLIENDITIALSNYSSGTTVSVSVAFITAEISVYEYSLDGVNFQTSNVFTGQSSGNYTIYVKDGFDCVTSKNFVIDGETTVSETVFEISNINSFRFAKVDNEKKNQLNTLSFNELTLTKYPYYQQFISSDVITTQFKTNAKYINCYKINNQGATTTLTELKKTDNIGLQAKTTCTYFDLGNGRSGVYFGVVDSLDFLTDAFIENLNYGNALPSWASVEGSYVTISDIGQVQIDTIEYSDEYNSFILGFDIVFSGSSERIISATYNLQPYEIYEFDTTMTDDLFNVVIEVGTDSDNIDFCYISECIKVVDDSEFLFDITYWDDENKGKFNYQTGIKNKLRLKGYQRNIGEQKTEGYDGDNEYYVTDNVVYDTQEFNFLRLSSEMANKLRLVVAHKNLLINGLYYKLAESPEVSGDVNYNMKKFIVTLKQGGEQFLTTGQENIIDTPEKLSIAGAFASAKENGLLAYTKNL